MKAARYYGKEDIRIDDIEPKSVEATDVRVDVTACGICGSDLHEYNHPQFTPEKEHPSTGASRPIVIGHEFSGVVSEVGTDVTRIDVGDSVAINPNIPCRDCVYCEDGAYNLCENVTAVGYQTGAGGFAESAVVGEQQVHRLPQGVAEWEGALVEPLAVGFHAVRRSGIQAGDTVGVFGCGPIGLTVVQAAVVAGAKQIFVSEPNEARRETAIELGADVAIDPFEEDPVEHITGETNGGANITFEFAGIEPTFNAAVRSTRRGGTITVGSVSDKAISTDLNDVVLTERTVKGTYCYGFPPQSFRTEFDAVIELLAEGRINTDSYVTKRIPLDEIVREGFETLLDPETEDVKVLVEP